MENGKRGATGDDEGRHDPTTPTPPSRLRRQPSWLDDFIPTPTWEDGVKSKPTYLANFEWSRSFWNPLNGSETMNILAMKSTGGTKGVAQLWVIGKLEYTSLVVNQYPTFTVKLCLANDDRNTLRMMLKKWGNLGKDWESSNIESVISFSTRPEKVEELIELITDDEEVRDIVQAIHLQDTFPFTYDVRKSAKVKGDYPDPGHDVDDFKAGARVAVEFQIVSRNFKASKRIDAVKAYSFRLLGVYLIDEPTNSTISTPEKRRRGDDEWMVTPPRTKKTITSINPLEC